VVPIAALWEIFLFFSPIASLKGSERVERRRKKTFMYIQRFVKGGNKEGPPGAAPGPRVIHRTVGSGGGSKVSPMNFTVSLTT